MERKVPIGDLVLSLRPSTRVRSLLVVLGVCAAMTGMGASRMNASFGDTRQISFFNIHNKETTTVLFRQNGKPVPGAMDKINWALRDWRKDEKTSMDPALVDLLWEIHAELGSREPIHVISAFRSRGTNDMLRKTVGGQASESRHILGKAADVHFPDVPLKNLRYSALVRERGGVGYYPTSALPFVHVDTDRVRHWPRLPRYELALLFPNGATQHQPAEGGPITQEDVQVARARHRDLAVQVAEFFDIRRSGTKQTRPPVAVADAGTAAQRNAPLAFAAPAPVPVPRPAPQASPLQQVAMVSPPQLVLPPRVVDRPSRLTAPTSAERTKLSELAQLASLSPPMPKLVRGPQPAPREPQAKVASATQLASLDTKLSIGSTAMPLTDQGWGNGFVLAPAFDEEHPEELSYRPFPIAPLLTASPSADDPALVTMQHPDIVRTLEMLDQAGSMPPMRLRPAQQVAALMLSQQFKGEAVNISAMSDGEPISPGPMSNRKVSTTTR